MNVLKQPSISNTAAIDAPPLEKLVVVPTTSQWFLACASLDDDDYDDDDENNDDEGDLFKFVPGQHAQKEEHDDCSSVSTTSTIASDASWSSPQSLRNSLLYMRNLDSPNPSIIIINADETKEKEVTAAAANKSDNVRPMLLEQVHLLGGLQDLLD